MPAELNLPGTPEDDLSGNARYQEYLKGFKTAIIDPLRSLFLDLFAVSAVQGSNGNACSQLGVSLFLKLMHLPAPDLGLKIETPHNIYAYPMRGSARFFLDAQRIYCRGIMSAWIAHLHNCQLYERSNRQIDVQRISKNQTFLNRIAAATDKVRYSPTMGLTWNGKGFDVSTLAEWVMLTEFPESKRTIIPGDRVWECIDNEDPYGNIIATSYREIQTGPDAGKVQLIGCHRKLRESVLTRFTFPIQHPLPEWIRGYEPMADQMVNKSRFEFHQVTATDWACFPKQHPMRMAIINSFKTDLQS